MKRTDGLRGRREDIVFLPALMPLEAAMLPARERPRSGALAHVQREMERRFFPETADGWDNQRAKI